MSPLVRSPAGRVVCDSGLGVLLNVPETGTVLGSVDMCVGKADGGAGYSG